MGTIEEAGVGTAARGRAGSKLTLQVINESLDFCGDKLTQVRGSRRLGTDGGSIRHYRLVA